LLAVVLITAGIHGGIGLRSLGSSVVGGRYYYYLIAGVLSYFAFASQIIPLDHVQTVLRMLFLPALLNAVSTVIYYAGPAFYFLYLVFPVAAAGVQAAAEQSGALVRFVGFSSAANFVALYVMARYGIRGILQKWWRVLFLIVLLVVSMLGGYRSTLILLILVLMALFVLEGLLRSPIFPALLLIGTLGLVALFPLAGKLPGSIQRSISFIPGLRIDSAIRMDAEGSTNWRLEIWKTLLPDLPKYVWLGKGYSLDPTDIYLTQQAVLRGRAADFEGSLLTGDYHSGPLSVYVPFGSFGFLAFVTFLITSLRGTYRNYIYGREELRTVNRFVFALFLVKIFFFLFVFGAFANDLSQFAGLAGLSVALNRGICTKPATNPRPVVFRGALSAGNTEPGLA
jgi:O-antigen ligase